MSKEAMKLALEALQTLHDENMDYLTRNKLGGENNQCMVFAREAITALREALAEPSSTAGYAKKIERLIAKRDALKAKLAEQPAQQEPVAWRTFDGEGGYEYRSYDMNEQYAQEWEQRNPKHKGWVEPLYTSPPQRSWVGLTDEEISDLWCKVSNTDFVTIDTHVFAEAIEAKLKERTHEDRN